MNQRNIDLLSLAIQANVPTLLIGEPGIGKTAIIRSIGDRLRRHTETITVSIRDATDFLGIYVVKGEYVVAHAPDWVERLIDAGDGILFLDELNTAPRSVQAAALRVIHECVVGDRQLPLSTSRVAAINPLDDGGTDLIPALANRFFHIQWEADADAWIRYVLDPEYSITFPVLPDGWEDLIQAKRALIASFISHRRELLQKFPKDETGRSQAWPSSRTWYEYAAVLLAASESVSRSDLDDHIVLGCVGSAGLEFLSWKQALDLPDPEQWVRDTDLWSPPKNRGDVALAALSNLVSWVSNHLTLDTWNATFEIIGRYFDLGLKDVAVMTLSPLVNAYFSRKDTDECLPLPPARILDELKKISQFVA